MHLFLPTREKRDCLQVNYDGVLNIVVGWLIVPNNLINLMLSRTPFSYLFEGTKSPVASRRGPIYSRAPTGRPCVLQKATVGCNVYVLRTHVCKQLMETLFFFVYMEAGSSHMVSAVALLISISDRKSVV